jgi:hypothetical protein
MKHPVFAHRLVGFAGLVIGRHFQFLLAARPQLFRRKVNNVRLWGLLLSSPFEKDSTTHASAK